MTSKIKNILKISCLTMFSFLLQVSVAHSFEVVKATHFELENPRLHKWEKGAPQYKSGTIIIAKVDPKVFQQTQTFMPSVLMGDRILERLDSGDQPNHLAFIAPKQLSLGRSLVYVTKLDRLPEDTSQKDRLAALQKAQTSRSIKPISHRFQIEQVKLKGEEELYKKASTMLIEFDPKARERLKHWL